MMSNDWESSSVPTHLGHRLCAPSTKITLLEEDDSRSLGLSESAGKYQVRITK